MKNQINPKAEAAESLDIQRRPNHWQSSSAEAGKR